MAVAVKTSSGATSPSPLSRAAVASLVGVVYVIGCLAVVFKLLPSLWVPAAEAIGLSSAGFVSGSLLGVLMLAAAAGLLYVGGRLLGPKAPPGVRAGIFVGLVGVLLVLLLARWASLWIEHWAYDRAWFSPSTGMGIAAAVGVALLALFLWLYTRPRAQRMIQHFEQGGWFHATSYKGNQG